MASETASAQSARRKRRVVTRQLYRAPRRGLPSGGSGRQRLPARLLAEWKDEEPGREGDGRERNRDADASVLPDLVTDQERRSRGHEPSDAACEGERAA